MFFNRRLALLVFALSASFASAIPDQKRGGGGDSEGDYDGDEAPYAVPLAAEPTPTTNTSSLTAPTSSATLVSAAAPSTTLASATPASGSVATQVLIGMKGDSFCTSLMCVGGLVNGSTVQYTLQSLSSAAVGWMAMGFGSQMSQSPMVIMWPNADGSITLSQRSTTGHMMPTVNPSPTRVATLETSLSSLNGSNPKLVYTIPNDGTTGSQSIIWAYSSKNPGSSAVDATLVQHNDADSMTLNLSNTLSTTSKDPTNPVITIAQSSAQAGSSGNSSSSNGTTSNPSVAAGSTDGTTTSTPMSSYEKMIIAHAVLCVTGFLVLLPAGAIFARWLRTSTVMWFKGHWIIQFALAGPVILIGFTLACVAVGPGGFEDQHTRWGLVIFILYLLQISLGGIIHYIKPKSFTIGKKRPIQNYGHAVLGLTIIGLSFFQVRTGYTVEWPIAGGLNPLGKGVDIIWFIWVIAVPLFYFGGLSLLPRQFQLERGAKASVDSFSSQTEINTRTRISTVEKYRTDSRV